MTIKKHELRTKLLLRQVHSIHARQYDGDYHAVVILIDLETAIKRAKLTDKQLEVLRLVFILDHTQSEVGRLLGSSQQAIDSAVKAAIKKIAKIYEDWSKMGSDL